MAYVNYAVTCNKPIIQSPSDATEVLGSFATPRQWENLARTVGAHHPDDVRAIGYGLVGAPAQPRGSSVNSRGPENRLP